MSTFHAAGPVVAAARLPRPTLRVAGDSLRVAGAGGRGLRMWGGLPGAVATVLFLALTARGIAARAPGGRAAVDSSQTARRHA